MQSSANVSFRPFAASPEKAQPMKTFIRAAEIWVPDADGYLLEFGSGLYDNAPAFGARSRAMCFGRGEGLPGKVWEEGCPVILQDLQGGHFQRASAAKAAALTCAVAFPVYFGALLKAVVVLFGGKDSDQSGAIEIWCNDPAAGSDLRLLDGVYGARDAAFEAASRTLALRRGTGLPGQAWEQGASVFLDGLADSAGFARGEAAARSELRRGLALPCSTPGPESCVLVLLSAPATPIATRIESWVAGGSAQSLKRAYGYDEATGPLPVAEFAAGEADGAIFETFAIGVPTVSRASPAAGGPGDAPGTARPAIVLPVVRESTVVEAVALYL